MAIIKLTPLIYLIIKTIDILLKFLDIYTEIFTFRIGVLRCFDVKISGIWNICEGNPGFISKKVGYWIYIANKARYYQYFY